MCSALLVIACIDRAFCADLVCGSDLTCNTCTGLTCKRTAPPRRLPCVPSRSTTNAASRSRASCDNRTPRVRDNTGAPSSTTSANTPPRNNKSAHHAPRVWSCGRTMMSRSPNPARSCGASVRVASTHATHPPSASTRATSCRTSDVLPAPSGPTTSVTRPRGTPPPKAASSSATPVGHAGPAPRPPATTIATSALSASRPVGEPSG